MKQQNRISELLKQIKEAERELEQLQDEQHNEGVDAAVKHFREELIKNATPAELKFKHIAKMKNLQLIFQYRVNIMSKRGRRIDKVYYADFCDWKNKLIFEIDGDYHSEPEQILKDEKRTKDLNRAGYKVFRISNEDVMNGKTTAFLYNAYKSIGISII